MITKSFFYVTSCSAAIGLLLRRTLQGSVLYAANKQTRYFFLFTFLCISYGKSLQAQLLKTQHKFTKADTLRGSLNANRTWWNVLHYNIEVKPHFTTKEIEGRVDIRIIAVKAGKQLQIDLQQPLQIDSIIDYENKTKLLYQQTENTTIVILPKFYVANSKHTLQIYYHGKPREAKRAPWDGGWIWKTDAKGRPWMSVAVQGLGASAWYPCKDHQSDEPDSGATLTMIVPDTLMAVANGKLIQTQKLASSNLQSFTWRVKNPINNYCIVPYIGAYTHFSDTLHGEKGILQLNYYVLDYNLEKAKTQFTQAKTMLHCFEYWFGAYPFYEDDYKLVESPHLGMEHQSAIAYGNGFKNGYLGRDLSGTGWGLKWDFIIVHESGHEWFANNITTNDIADMWVHEGFTNYSETLYTEWLYGKEAGYDYCAGIRKNIRNDEPIIGTYGVNKEGSGDMYYKAANMIHNIRNVLSNDVLFRKILRGLNARFYHKTTTTTEVENYISQQTGISFQQTFNQYLRTTQIPELQYFIDTTNQKLTIKWANCIPQFNMPITISSTKKRIDVTTTFTTFQLNNAEFAWFNKKNIERNYYLQTKPLSSQPQ